MPSIKTPLARPARARLVVGALSLALLAACTAKGEATAGEGEPGAAAEATELEPGTSAASLKLEVVAKQLEGDEITDVKALEAKINDPEAELSAVDVDEDGVIDFVQVVETREGDKTVLVFQAIPSSKKGEKVEEIAVEVARIELEVEAAETKEADKVVVVHATYSEHIHHDPEVHVYHHEVPVVVEHGTVVFEEGCFFHHVFIVDHELYVGHHGHVVVEVHHDVHKHKKHKKHKHHKHKGHKHKGHGHGGNVVITW